jgi:glutamyl-tRNA reductase
MRLLLVGLSHRTAPVELREAVDFARRGLAAALDELGRLPGVREAAVVSTCNRAELYAAAPEVERAAAALARFLGEFHGVAPERLAPHLYQRTDGAVATHLFRVAAGLDSLVVGEPQILGQVKAAYAAAHARGRTGPLLNRLFHAAFVAGKRVRTETALGEGAVSVSYAAVSLAKKIFGELAGRHVLILGAGEMAKLTGRHLKRQGVTAIRVASRTLASAQALAADLGGAAVDWRDLDGALEPADIVITATGASQPILTRARIAAAMRARRNRPLFVIDIAVPRDVEAEAGELEQVFLYNIDDLEAIVHENLARRTSELDRAEAIVREEAEAFDRWLRAREAIPTVVALRERFEAIRRAELQRLEGKLAALGPDAKARVDEITHLIVEKLLLAPTEQLKAASAPEEVLVYTEALNRLFDLAPAPSSEPEAADPASPEDPAARNRS